ANDDAHRQSPSSLVVSVGGVVVTASQDHTVRLWDAATGKQQRKLQHGGSVQAIAVSPDGTKVASSSMDDTVRLWDAATGREIYQLAGHGRLGGYRFLVFTPDGKRLLSWGDDFYLRVWDMATGKALHENRLQPTGVKVPEGDEEDRDRRELFFFQYMGTFLADAKVF